MMIEEQGAFKARRPRQGMWTIFWSREIVGISLVTSISRHVVDDV